VDYLPAEDAPDGIEDATPSKPSRISKSETSLGMKAVCERANACTSCELHATRTNVVFGTGNPDARLMFIGEGPGFYEDKEGIPFVGKAGQLLTKIIAAMKFARDGVYICNVVKCRPPENRNPEPVEIQACSPYLTSQIDIVQPDVIVALGRIAAETLSGRPMPIMRSRGTWFSYKDIPVMPTFHPAYLLRNPDAKRQTWDDMKAVMGRLQPGESR
jgi:DNA polymerase